ncbi:LOW QUALITY PROTEIN: hypothetical protein Cgig2_009249 [Carnegiea gigantea]|uniref:RNase H type-1 domain-containing protein n=1 Tax=Carnegiea gigantea TaxID=171969 RepID=A0A9Q1K0H3_9CARY|nr:LOW QUALITY PROTEIN: hypothetical protein Cgig2_009249 [Carnegiea gigantea]
MHLDTKLFDHLPIHIILSSDKRAGRHKIGGFKFENMWALHKDFHSIIKTACESICDTNHLKALKSKCQALSSALHNWNISTFGHVQDTIKTLESSLWGTLRVMKKSLKKSALGAGRRRSYGYSANESTSSSMVILTPNGSMPGQTTPNFSLLVADLIDFNEGCWKEDFIRAIFKPCDVDYILNTPLCPSWLDHQITWQFKHTGEFSARLDTIPSTRAIPENWCPPETERWKLNFDAGKLAEWGRGLGFIVRDSLGDIVMVGTKQIMGLHRVDLAEAEACLFGIKHPIEAGYSNLVIKGDSLSVITKLRNKSNLQSSLVVDKCSSFAWSHVRREGNRAAHKAAHLQPYVVGIRIWTKDVPMSISELASEDTCNFLEAHLI